MSDPHGPLDDRGSPAPDNAWPASLGPTGTSERAGDKSVVPASLESTLPETPEVRAVDLDPTVPGSLIADSGTSGPEVARVIADEPNHAIPGPQSNRVPNRYPLLVPIVLWLLIAAGVVAAVLQGWSLFTPTFQFNVIRPVGTIFSEFDQALVLTGWSAPWRLVIWALAAIAIAAGLVATGFAFFARKDEPEAAVRNGE